MPTRIVGAIELEYDVALAGKLVCPNCGDTKFGSLRLQDGALLRTCHGWVNGEEPCGFKWPQSDDHKFFFVALKDYLESAQSEETKR